MKINKYKTNQKVLVVFCYGDALPDGKSTYCDVKEAIIDKIQYIESRDAYLYFLKLNAGSYIVGEHMIFNLNEEEKAEELARDMRG